MGRFGIGAAFAPAAALLWAALALPALAQDDAQIELFVVDPKDDPFVTGAAPSAGTDLDLPPLVACLSDPSSAACGETGGGGEGDIELEVHIVLPGGGAAEAPATPAGSDGYDGGGAAAQGGDYEEPVYSVDVAIQFDYDSAEIRASEWPKLATLATALRHEALAGTPFVLVGHTDAKGSEAYNCDLSARRARSVEAAMTQLGVARLSLASVGAGESTLIQGLPPVDPGHRRVGLVRQAEAGPIVERARLLCRY